MLPGDVKSLTVTTQPQLFIGDMLQHLHSSQIAAAAAAAGSAKLTTTMVSSLKSDIKREDTPTVSYATSQFLQGIVNFLSTLVLINRNKGRKCF